MKYICRFNESWNSLVQEINLENYKELSEILQSEVFDEYDIYYDENYDADHTTWTYDSTFTSLDDNDNYDIICIYNVKPNIHDDLVKDLDDKKDLIMNMLGFTYEFESLDLIRYGKMSDEKQIEIKIID